MPKVRIRSSTNGSAPGTPARRNASKRQISRRIRRVAEFPSLSIEKPEPTKKTTSPLRMSAARRSSVSAGKEGIAIDYLALRTALDAGFAAILRGGRAVRATSAFNSSGVDVDMSDSERRKRISA